MKLSLGNLKLNYFPPYPTNAYTYGVSITSRLQNTNA